MRAKLGTSIYTLRSLPLQSFLFCGCWPQSSNNCYSLYLAADPFQQLLVSLSHMSAQKVVTTAQCMKIVKLSHFNFHFKIQPDFHLHFWRKKKYLWFLSNRSNVARFACTAMLLNKTFLGFKHYGDCWSRDRTSSIIGFLYDEAEIFDAFSNHLSWDKVVYVWIHTCMYTIPHFY